VGAARYLTLVWPGLPWLWLRGSRLGLGLALAFAITLDIAVVTTWIWPELVELPLRLAVWSGTGIVWLLGTASALSAFPPPLPLRRDATVDRLFVEARDAYLGRDWLTAEARLTALLSRSPTDGEAQLLFATLLRRVGRTAEARSALDRLAASDAGLPWRAAAARERSLLERGDRRHAADSAAATLPLHADVRPPEPQATARDAA
jgi:hypothetical protein